MQKGNYTQLFLYNKEHFQSSSARSYKTDFVLDNNENELNTYFANKQNVKNLNGIRTVSFWFSIFTKLISKVTG